MKTTSLLAALLLLAASQATAYQITGTAVSREHNLVRTEYTVQAGVHPLDRFKMTRLVRDVPPDQLRGSILFFFPLGTTFSFYEQRDPNGAFGMGVFEGADEADVQRSLDADPALKANIGFRIEITPMRAYTRAAAA